jgi:hypothetical protein
MRRRSLTIAGLLLAAGLAAGQAACGTAGRACTLIGCSDGLTVELAGSLPADYTVTARVDGAVVQRVECGAARDCRGEVFLEGVTAANVELEVTSGAVSERREVAPSYATVQPNGPGCPPICRQARVRIEL